MDIGVIGAGVARTGTTSTKAALEALGFNPCYTYVSLFQRPQDVDRWLAAYAGEPMDWHRLFADFRATVDWPACDFYEQLMDVYPQAKVVLNVRDPETWYESMTNTVWEVHQAEVQAGRGPDTDGQSRLREVMIWQGFFGGKFLDKQYAMSVFQQRIEQVKERVPPDRLLVFDVKEGWEPLCRFLGAAVPEQPFPRLNDTEAFRQLVRRMVQAHETSPAGQAPTGQSQGR